LSGAFAAAPVFGAAPDELDADVSAELARSVLPSSVLALAGLPGSAGTGAGAGFRASGAALAVPSLLAGAKSGWGAGVFVAASMVCEDAAGGSLCVAQAPHTLNKPKDRNLIEWVMVRLCSQL